MSTKYRRTRPGHRRRANLYELQNRWRELNDQVIPASARRVRWRLAAPAVLIVALLLLAQRLQSPV